VKVAQEADPLIWAVRRLTPRECERLQGFPDDYTNVPYGRRNWTPDGPRYKAMGNSMAVNVMGWIGQRIETVERLLHQPWPKRQARSRFQALGKSKRDRLRGPQLYEQSRPLAGARLSNSKWRLSSPSEFSRPAHVFPAPPA